MNLFHLLAQLRRIKADAEYTKRSRVHIVAFAREHFPIETRLTPRASLRIILRALESGFAIALTGVLLILAVGGFSTLRKPIGVAGLDPAGLRAEAEAIDIQIQLSGLDYTGVVQEEEGNQSTVVGVLKKATRAIGVLKEGDSENSDASSASATIDATLEILAE